MLVLTCRAKPGSNSGMRAAASNTGIDRDLITTRGGAIGGGLIGSGAIGDRASAGAAFVHIAPRSMPLPVLIAVPHAGRAYTGDVLAQMRDPEMSQLRLEDRHIDNVGVEVARATGTGLLVAHAPRAMLDLNRADDDVDWDMIERPAKGAVGASAADNAGAFSAANRGNNARARSGLGLVPRRLPGFGEIWRGKLPRGELEQRIDTIHRPYHEFLARELERIRDAWGAALLIDLHSMPPLRRQQTGVRGEGGAGNDEPAPQVVLGDRFGASCHTGLVSRAFRYLDEAGCAASHNRPYSGGYVLDRHAATARGIHAVQLEICRSTYLDAALSEPTEAVKPLAMMLAGLVRELGAATAGLGARMGARMGNGGLSDDGLAQAAE